MTVSTEELINLPKQTLDQAAQKHEMPNRSSATKTDIAQWLVQNQPDTAQQLADQNGSDGSDQQN